VYQFHHTSNYTKDVKLTLNPARLPAGKGRSTNSATRANMDGKNNKFL
ncbi:MAG: hypothetical protein ACI840_002474, partial [Ulvibacter sp.]